jgi:hypothetical protein
MMLEEVEAILGHTEHLDCQPWPPEEEPFPFWGSLLSMYRPTVNNAWYLEDDGSSLVPGPAIRVTYDLKWRVTDKLLYEPSVKDCWERAKSKVSQLW